MLGVARATAHNVRVITETLRQQLSVTGLFAVTIKAIDSMRGMEVTGGTTPEFLAGYSDCRINSLTASNL